MEDVLFVGAKLSVTHQCLMAEGDEFTKRWSFSGRQTNQPSVFEDQGSSHPQLDHVEMWKGHFGRVTLILSLTLYLNITHGDEKSLTCLETTGDSPKGTHELGEFS